MYGDTVCLSLDSLRRYSKVTIRPGLSNLQGLFLSRAFPGLPILSLLEIIYSYGNSHHRSGRLATISFTRRSCRCSRLIFGIYTAKIAVTEN